MLNKIAITLAACISLAGCSSPKWAVDQDVRQRLFVGCLKALPTGPSTTKYGDWERVVSNCSDLSFIQSRYCVKHCPSGVQTQPFIKPNQAQN